VRRRTNLLLSTISGSLVYFIFHSSEVQISRHVFGMYRNRNSSRPAYPTLTISCGMTVLERCRRESSRNTCLPRVMAWIQLTAKKHFAALGVVISRDLLHSPLPTPSIMTSLITGALKLSVASCIHKSYRR
jgi:hypothetical protein